MEYSMLAEAENKYEVAKKRCDEAKESLDAEKRQKGKNRGLEKRKIKEKCDAEKRQAKIVCDHAKGAFMDNEWIRILTMTMSPTVADDIEEASKKGPRPLFDSIRTAHSSKVTMADILASPVAEALQVIFRIEQAGLAHGRPFKGVTFNKLRTATRDDGSPLALSRAAREAVYRIVSPALWSREARQPNVISVAPATQPSLAAKTEVRPPCSSDMTLRAVTDDGCYCRPPPLRPRLLVQLLLKSRRPSQSLRKPLPKPPPASSHLSRKTLRETTHVQQAALVLALERLQRRRMMPPRRLAPAKFVSHKSHSIVLGICMLLLLYKYVIFSCVSALTGVWGVTVRVLYPITAAYREHLA
jgi:hypothetical protein